MVTAEKIFKVNKYISLKLRGNKTYVYINNVEVKLCKKLAVKVQTNKLNDIYKIKSVDDLENVNYTEIDNKDSVTSETEFFVHCSNLEPLIL